MTTPNIASLAPTHRSLQPHKRVHRLRPSSQPKRPKEHLPSPTPDPPSAQLPPQKPHPPLHRTNRG
ncbi:hypothetical protein K456DRAFT_57531 [Colletotrichum gloeosporioides 23]|nr:hypothetical protein K456DRAFT_57531 [Colletotrichum gloeosporioides 23]